MRRAFPPPANGAPGPFRKTAAAALREALPEPRLLTTDAPPTVYINPMRREDELLVHLVNYDWDAVADAMHPVGPVALSVALQEGDEAPAEALLASPDRPDVRLQVTLQDGRMRLVVPELATWAVVRLML